MLRYFHPLFLTFVLALLPQHTYAPPLPLGCRLDAVAPRPSQLQVPASESLIAHLRSFQSRLTPLPHVDNEAFARSYHLGLLEERLVELGYIDFKGRRMEIRVGERTFLLHSELSQLKALNDGPFKGAKEGADVIVAIANRAIEDQFGPGSEVRRLLSLNPERVEERFAAAAQRAVEQFTREISSIEGLKECIESWGINIRHLMGIGSSDRSLGGGFGDVAAALAARFTRREEDNPYRSFESVIEILKRNRNKFSELNAGLLRVASGLFEVTPYGRALKEGVFELARKSHSEREFRELLKHRYGISLSDRVVEDLDAYIRLIDTFSSPLFVERPQRLPWGDGVPLTGDLVGGGAENLSELERFLLSTLSNPDPLSILRASRGAEQAVTGRMHERKNFFIRTIQEWAEREAGDQPHLRTALRSVLRTGASADDMLGMIPPEFFRNASAVTRITRELNRHFQGRIRMTLGADAYSDTRVPLPIALKKRIAGSFESIHKNAILIGESLGINPAHLAEALIIPCASIDSGGTVRIQLVVSSSHSIQKDLLLKSFQQAIEKENLVEGISRFHLILEPIYVRN